MVAARLAAAALLFASPARGLEVKLVSLVQARTPDWREVPRDAVIDRGRLSFKKKVFLESRRGMRVWSPEVKKALAGAMESLPKSDRKKLSLVLASIGNWARNELKETPAPPGCPASWLSAAEVLRAKRGNRFEILRTLVTVLRAADVPARPTFNGAPVIYHYVTTPGKKSFWTVWDPFGWSGAPERLPVLWLPLRAGEIHHVRAKPGDLCPHPSLEGRRYASREEAEIAFGHLKEKGSFPAGGEEFPESGWERWWEVWTVGARLDAPPEQAFELSFPVPFVRELEYGMREHAVWTSDPARLGRVSRVSARTDQALGGVALSVRVRLVPAAGAADG